MAAPHRILDLPTEADTRALAGRIAPTLRPGDVLLLDGPVGAGKSAFARALIRARLGDPAAEVPSPTYTLVQTYDAGDVELTHADLYRLSSPDEAVELGLLDAFETAICLVEWPDRLGALAPVGALRLRFEALADGRHRLTLSGPAGWAELLEAA